MKANTVKGNDAVVAYLDEVHDMQDIFGDVHVVLNFQGEVPIPVFCSQVSPLALSSLISCCSAHLAGLRELPLTLDNASRLEQEVWDELEFVLNERYRSPCLQFIKDGVTFRVMPCETGLPRTNTLVLDNVQL